MLQARNLRLQEVNWGLASREDATKQQRRSSQAGESEGEDALALSTQLCDLEKTQPCLIAPKKLYATGKRLWKYYRGSTRGKMRNSSLKLIHEEKM